jgi:hypothetical protein
MGLGAKTGQPLPSLEAKRLLYGFLVAGPPPDSVSDPAPEAVNFAMSPYLTKVGAEYRAPPVRLFAPSFITTFPSY